MLVLSRREAQSIVIGGNIVVTVVSVRGDQVRLGIDAPRSITVHRQEVALAIEAANREALAQGDFDPASLPRPAGAATPRVPPPPRARPASPAQPPTTPAD
jgi:carbon storage regulator